MGTGAVAEAIGAHNRTQGEGLHGPGYIERAIADVVDDLKTAR